MRSSDYIALGGLIVELVGMITGFILQRDKKQKRDLVRENKKLANRLRKSLMAIKGYQKIEETQAKRISKDVVAYRREIRNGFSEYFDSSYVTPKKIDEMLEDLNK